MGGANSKHMYECNSCEIEFYWSGVFYFSFASISTWKLEFELVLHSSRMVFICCWGLNDSNRVRGREKIHIHEKYEKKKKIRRNHIAIGNIKHEHMRCFSLLSYSTLFLFPFRFAMIWIWNKKKNAHKK